MAKLESQKQNKQKKSRHEKISESLRQGYNIVNVSIPSYHIADDVVVYEIDVSNKQLRWNLWLRYEYFYVLHQMMQELVNELSSSQTNIMLPPFPEKRLKLFVDHFDEHFIENRRMLLSNYITQILKNSCLKHSEIFISFLTPPDNEEINKTNDNNYNNNSDDSKDKESDHTSEDESLGKFKSNIKKNILKTIHNKKQNSYNGINNNNPKNGINNENNLNSKSGNNNDNNSDYDTDNNNNDTNNKNKDDLMNQTIIDMKTNYQVDYVGIDDGDEVTDVWIESAQILKNDHTIYQVHVYNLNKRKSFSEWTVLKRFCDFVSFDNQLREIMTNDFPQEMHLIPPLPPKYLKLFIDHLDETFIEKRRLLLQCYLQRLIKYPLLRRHEYTLTFLGVYNQD